MKLLKEVELVKEGNACFIKKTKITVLEEMKEELRPANEETVELERRYIAIIDNMKQVSQKTEQETKMISSLKDTEILTLKKKISDLQQTKLVIENIDDTIHKTLNIEPVKSKETQVTGMQND